MFILIQYLYFVEDTSRLSCDCVGSELNDKQKKCNFIGILQIGKGNKLMILKNIKKAGNKDDDNCIKQANWKKITFMKVTVGSGEQIENLK